MDLIQVAGKYPPPHGDSEILGVEGELFNYLHAGVCCYLLSASGL